MPNLRRFRVVPSVPEALEPLVAIAYNLWWSWHREARDLFARIDPALYEAVSENPLAVLARAPQARLDELARDPGYLEALDRVRRSLAEYLGRRTWFETTLAPSLGLDLRIAYFSMEFGMHEALPIYSGGLGVLAGDHLKSASDLGLPLVGVGIAFSQGYFRQSLDEEGWQAERYPPNDWHDLPVRPVADEAGRPTTVTVALPALAHAADGGGATREVVLQAWRVEVGRVPLILLDANVEANRPEDRALTNTLYGGDRTHRICQEILLGVGGIRMLRAIGLAPTICHMNEGHSAFLALERVRELMQQHGASFAVACEVASAGSVFTTHTPVPAGNDAFPHNLVAPYLDVLAKGLGTTGEQLLRLGRVDPEQAWSEFSMPVLAIRLSDRHNGVSVLHGREARAMWRVLWPGLPLGEVPIGSITNGVHVGTWVAPELAALYTRHLGPGWWEDGVDPGVWQRILDVPDEELWRAHEARRARLIEQIRRHAHVLAERWGHPIDPAKVAGLLDPRVLTIGFARRFATYKRGTLLLRDADRLLRILSRADRPVQLVFAGKAHPQDWGGKELIHAIVRASRSEGFRGRVVFVEDYDMGVARALVSGVDVWLNTPRRPLEACGTSGMKAAINGVLHASILDGWWAEAYAGDNGFAIGRGEEHADAEHGDRVEALGLYRLLEDDIVPLFYEREGGVPRGWVARMKRSIATVAPRFNTSRMVREYLERMYLPAARRKAALLADDLAGARAVCDYRARIAAAWPSVRIESVTAAAPSTVVVGQEVPVAAEVHLGSIAPAEVAVELYHGRPAGSQALEDGMATPMRCAAELGDGRYRYAGSIVPRESGEHAFAVRVVPFHEAFPGPFAARLLAWS